MLLVGGVLLVGAGMVPPSRDTIRTAYADAQASNALYWDKDYWVAWPVPRLFGPDWTCRVHLDSIGDRNFIAEGFFECSPWPDAYAPRHGSYSSGTPIGG